MRWAKAEAETLEVAMSEDARKIAEHHSAALDAEKGGRRPGKPPRLAPQGAAKWDFMKGQKAGLGKLRAVGDSCEQLPVGWQWVGWQWGGVAVAVASSCPFVDVSSSCVHWVGSPPCGASSVQSRPRQAPKRISGLAKRDVSIFTRSWIRSMRMQVALFWGGSRSVNDNAES